MSNTVPKFQYVVPDPKDGKCEEWDIKRTGYIVSSAPEVVQERSWKRVVSVYCDGIELIMKAAVLHGFTGVHSPIKVQQNLEYRGEDSGPS
jgi:hypothetical protein